MLPESARWLISRRKIKDALVILRRAAKINKVSLPPEIHSVKVTEEDGSSVKEIIKQMLKSRKLFLYWVVAISNW